MNHSFVTAFRLYTSPPAGGSGHHRAGSFEGCLEIGPAHAGRDEEFLARAGAERDGLPAVLRGHRNAHADLTASVAHRTDDAGNYGADIGVGCEQRFEDAAHA